MEAVTDPRAGDGDAISSDRQSMAKERTVARSLTCNEGTGQKGRHNFRPADQSGSLTCEITDAFFLVARNHGDAHQPLVRVSSK